MRILERARALKHEEKIASGMSPRVGHHYVVVVISRNCAQEKRSVNVAGFSGRAESEEILQAA